VTGLNLAVNQAKDAAGAATNTLLNWATVVPTSGLTLDGTKAFEVAGRWRS
jgi:hypothetical protein